MGFEISKYKKDPQLLITAKIKRLMELESRPIPNLDNIKTISELFKESEKYEKRRDNLALSLFRDVISLDFAKSIASKTRMQLNEAFRLIKAAINMKSAKILLENETIKIKNATLFQLNEKTKKEIEESFIKQINEGKKQLRLPDRFY